MKTEGLTALEASFIIWEGWSWMYQLSSVICIFYLYSGCPSRSQKNQVGMQRLNLLPWAVIMSSLLAEDTAGLVQRIYDSILISFPFLQCVWSV